MLRALDRLEEILIATLMAAAVLLIFTSVLHRFSIGFAADLVRYARVNEMPELQATARSVFNTINSLKMTWAQELCIYLFVWMAKFGAAYGVRKGIHVGVDILVERLTGRPQQVFTLIAMSGGVIFTALVAYIGADFVYHVYHGGQISPDLEIKMWIVYLAVPLGSILMCFRFLQTLVHYIRTGEQHHADHAHVDGLDDDSSEGDKA